VRLARSFIEPLEGVADDALERAELVVCSSGAVHSFDMPGKHLVDQRLVA
jgi:hypothetical protein